VLERTVKFALVLERTVKFGLVLERTLNAAGHPCVLPKIETAKPIFADRHYISSHHA
jgi:hypothetical protein